MDLGLEGKVAVVTGASKGIGLAVVEALSGEGMQVVAGALTVDTLKDREHVTAVAVDLVSPDGAAQLVDEAVERHGRLDVLVNNVGGVQLRLNGFLDVTDEDFERSFQLNFFAALRATRKAVAQMLGQGGGTIVNVASVNSFYHPDGLVIDYGAAKADDNACQFVSTYAHFYWCPLSCKIRTFKRAPTLRQPEMAQRSWRSARVTELLPNLEGPPKLRGGIRLPRDLAVAVDECPGRPIRPQGSGLHYGDHAFFYRLSSLMVGKVRCCPPRVDDIYTELRQEQRVLHGEHGHGRFRRPIIDAGELRLMGAWVAHARQRPKAAADIDDHAVGAGQKEGEEGVGHPDQADHVRLVYRRYVGSSNFLRRLGRAPDPCIVDQDVKAGRI